MSGIFPSLSRVPTMLGFLLGCLVGWLCHPSLWLVMGPASWAARMAATASQESGWNPEAAGDDGRSVGLVQFHDTTWTSLTGGSDLSLRTSCFLSGFYSARYVATALDASWSWYLVAVPIFGFAVQRYMWTHGISASAAEAAWSEAWASTSAEGRSWAAFGAWRALTLPVTVLLVLALWRGKWRRRA